MTIYRHGPLGKTGRASEDFGPGSPQCAVTIAHAGLQRFGRLLRWRGIFVSAAVRDHAYRIHEGKAGASHSDPIDPCADSVIQSAGHATTTAVIFIFDQAIKDTRALTRQTQQCHRLKRRIKAHSAPPEERQA
jgi:hypothetical protein